MSGADRYGVDVTAIYDDHHNNIRLEIANPGPLALVIAPGESESRRLSLERTGGWYDLTVTIEGKWRFATHLAGHVESGEDSISDPLIGGLV